MKKQNVTKEQLEELYLVQQLSTRDIAEKLNVGQTTIRRWLKSFDIPTRSSKEAKQTTISLEKQQKLAERYKEEYKQRSIDSGHRLTKVCPQCGKVFEFIKSQEPKYCSKKCADAAKTKKHFCNKCGKELDSKSAKYCKECLTQIKHDAFYNRVETTCGYCGQPMLVIPSRIKENEKCYCSQECMANDYKTRFYGENSPTWKGGKRHYQGHWLSQRILALERDNYKCQICGKTAEEQDGINMSVHHICNYRNFEDKEEANKLDNLICLCHECHTFVHSNANVDKLYIQDKIQSDLTSDSELT